MIVVAPDWVIAPLEIAAKVLATLAIDTVPNCSAFASVIAMLPPAPTVVSATAPRKSLALVSVIALPKAPELKETAPVPVVIVVAPDWVIAPLETTVSVLARFAIDTVPSVSALMSVIATLPPVLVTATAPVKLLAWVSVTAPAPVTKVAVPAPAACVSAPVWVMVFAPVAVTASVPLPTFETPRMIALASVTATLFAPVLFRPTAPMKLFAALVSVIAPAPVVNVAAPAPNAAACTIAPVCVMLLAPVAVTVSVPDPTPEAPSTSALASVIATLFAPEFESDTAPVKSLPALVSVIAFAPEVNELVPETVAAPVCVSAPVVCVNAKLPPLWVTPASDSTPARASVIVTLPDVVLAISSDGVEVVAVMPLPADRLIVPAACVSTPAPLMVPAPSETGPPVPEKLASAASVSVPVPLAVMPAVNTMLWPARRLRLTFATPVAVARLNALATVMSLVASSVTVVPAATPAKLPPALTLKILFRPALSFQASV